MNNKYRKFTDKIKDNKQDGISIIITAAGVGHKKYQGSKSLYSINNEYTKFFYILYRQMAYHLC